MNVLFDFQIMHNQKFGGISRYYFELMNEYEKVENVDAAAVCWFSKNSYFREYFRKKPCFEGKKVKGSRVINEIVTRGYLLTHKVDIFQPTYYSPYFLKFYKGKIVLTVYDMIHEIFPEAFPEGDTTVVDKAKLMHRADRIIAISESTKRDILKFYPDIPEEKIEVIYIGSNFEKSKKIPEDVSFPENYVLFVGSRGRYKNYDLFFESMKPVLDKYPELSLVCLGAGKFNDHEKEMHGKYQNRVFQFDVTDEILSYAYSHAECFVFPSKYEGFGIPTLEAFACECPVVLSNTSSMPEVGGDAVLYCDPYDSETITRQITRILEEEALSEELVKKGKERLKQFEWHEVARKTLECYKKVLNGDG